MKGARVWFFSALVEHLFELGGLEAEFADLLEELALLPDAVDEEAENHQDEDDDGEVTEPGEEGPALFGEVAEETAGEDEGFAPDERAGEIPGEEARDGHAGLAGDGSGNGAEAGDELCEEQGGGAAAVEVALGFADAGGGLKGEAAEELEYAVAVATTEEEPDGVGYEAGGKHREHDVEVAEAVRGAEGSGSEEYGDAGDGDAELLHQHPEEDDEVRVMYEEDGGDRHGSLLSFKFA